MFKIFKRYIFPLGVSLLLWAFPFSQNNTPTDITITTESNVPITVIDKDKFTFELLADNFSLNKNETLDFRSTQLVLITTISNQNGSGTIKFLDKDLNVLQTVDLNASRISTQRLSFNTIPTQVTIQLEKFSGNVSLVLKK